MKDLFISYAHEDSDTAQRLASLLEAAGLTVWWDPQLRAGQDFALEIERVLQQVRSVIVLWSAHSVDSHWVRAEANEGLRLGKLVPAALDDSTPPLVFRALHTARIDVEALDTDTSSVQKLIDDISAMLGQTSDGVTGTAVVPAPVPHPWHSPVKIAGTVAVAFVIMALSALPARLLDWLTGTMAASPLDFPPGATEATMMIVALTLLLVGGWRLHIGRYRSKQWVAFVILAALTSMACVYTWSERWISPAADHLSGTVVSTEWNDMEILALGSLERSLPLGEVPVSTENGEFGMRLRRAFFDRPRKLLIMKPGCEFATTPLLWQQWRGQEPIIIDFRCIPRT